MKRLLTFALLLFALCQVAMAQMPKGFTYQAVVRNASGHLMPNASIGLRITILKEGDMAEPVFVQIGRVMTNNNGLFTIVVGNDSQEFANINWGEGPYYLLSEMDPAGGSEYTLVTKQMILGVPYAQYAAVAERVIGGIASESDPYFLAWNYEYDSLRNAPTRLGDFINDMHFLTADSLQLSLHGDTLFLTGGSYVVLTGLGAGTGVNQVLSLGHDTIFLSDGGFVVIPPTDYNNLINRPTNLSQFSNDLGFITAESQTLSLSHDTLFLTNGGFVCLTSLTGTNQQLSMGHDTIYLTNGGSVVLPPTDYNNIINRPTSLSQFSNDLGFIAAESQALSIAGDTISLTNGGSVVLPPTDYNNLLNRPNSLSQFTNDLGFITAESQTLSIVADTLYLTNGGSVVLDALSSGNQQLSIDGDTLYLTNGGSVVLPSVDYSNVTNTPTLSTVAETGSYNDLTGRPTIPTIPTHVSSFINDAGYLSSYTETQGLSDVMSFNNNANAQIKNLLTPTAPADAANKSYVDSCMLALLTRMSQTIDSLNQRIVSLEHPLIEGSLNGVFSVSATSKITFSRGNLQYMASINTFNFAEHQYDMIGTANQNISSSYNGWIDLFGFGTSGWNSGVSGYQPWSSSTNNADYRVLLQGIDLTGIYVNADWGMFNIILNGSNKTGMWRTLTFDEWNYIFHLRPNAANLKGLATVAGVTGYVLLPDSWTLPAGFNFNPLAVLYSENNYTAAQWDQLEANGAVFLPSGGFRNGTSVLHVGNIGYYWSSSHDNSSSAKSISIGESYSGTSSNNYSNGCSVRLVREY